MPAQPSETTCYQINAPDTPLHTISDAEAARRPSAKMENLINEALSIVEEFSSEPGMDLYFKHCREYLPAFYAPLFFLRFVKLKRFSSILQYTFPSVFQ